MNAVTQKIPAPLDPAFRPAVLAARAHLQSAAASHNAAPLVLGIEREDRLLSRYETRVKADADPETLRHVERLVKFLVWARGGWKIHFGGPPAIGRHIARCYSANGSRVFDADLMSRVYGRAFEVELTDPRSVPPEKESAVNLGGHLDGCRIGFDLGASDYKVAAVRDGEVLYTEEFPWDPRTAPDPEYHYRHVSDALKRAAAHLPRVEAIGGSSAGVIVNNRIMVASLLRAVPAERLEVARNLFLRLRAEWRVPLAVANDGDVTALAGAMSLRAKGLLGISMGSSQAAGYLTRKGAMTGWLNELAFAPVDYNPAAAADEWSGDVGVGVCCFSQQAVNRLLSAAGMRLPDGMALADRLKQVQQLMSAGDERAARIYQTIGVYLGYTLPHYADFYDFEHVLVLGRVTTGQGGDIILGKAREVLTADFPDLAAKVQLHVPDERSRRIGQAVAAASLPLIA